MRKYFVLFFIIGIIFRLWISHLVPQPFGFDQSEYHYFAVQMLQKGLVAWQPRLYGYPLLLAVIFKIFGSGNFLAVAVVQSIIDCFTGVLIYLIGVKIFRSQKIAWISYLLYLFNPFTSVFVVLTLSEVWGVFLMAVIFYLLIEFAEVNHGFFAHLPKSSRLDIGTQGGGRAQKAWSPRKLYLITFLLGYLPQVRPAFLFYSIFLFGVISIWFYKNYKFKRGILIVVLLFILPFIYNIVGNWVYFKQFSPTTVDNLLVREFYISLYVPGRSPFHAKDPDVFPPEVQKIYNEYTPVPQNEYERKVMARKYLNLGLIKVMENPTEFVLSRIRKLWYVWEKHFLYYYEQPEDKFVNFETYWGNNLLIFSGFAGFISWFSKNRKSHLLWFGWLVIFTIVYISLVHTLSLAEERYSLPGYPVIFLFAGFGVWGIIKKLYDSSF